MYPQWPRYLLSFPFMSFLPYSFYIFSFSVLWQLIFSLSLSLFAYFIRFSFSFSLRVVIAKFFGKWWDYEMIIHHRQKLICFSFLLMFFVELPIPNIYWHRRDPKKLTFSIFCIFKFSIQIIHCLLWPLTWIFLMKWSKTLFGKVKFNILITGTLKCLKLNIFSLLFVRVSTNGTKNFMFIFSKRSN
jgi:hypothetical protein